MVLHCTPVDRGAGEAGVRGGQRGADLQRDTLRAQAPVDLDAARGRVVDGRLLRGGGDRGRARRRRLTTTTMIRAPPRSPRRRAGRRTAAGTGLRRAGRWVCGAAAAGRVGCWAGRRRPYRGGDLGRAWPRGRFRHAAPSGGVLAPSGRDTAPDYVTLVDFLPAGSPARRVTGAGLWSGGLIAGRPAPLRRPHHRPARPAPVPAGTG